MKLFSLSVRGTVAVLLGLIASCSGEPPESPIALRPNILLVLVDDMGYSDVGAFGSEVRTPTLDRLAEGGLRFTQFYTTAKCFPSRAALLTGLYPEQVGMDASPQASIRDATTIAAALKRAGYSTYMVGKHHATDHPLDLGFDHYIGLRDGAANHFNPGTIAREGEPAPARKYDRAPDGRWWCFERDCKQGYLPDDPEFYSTDFYTSSALEFLDDAGEQEAPFFIYLAYQAPHDPLHAWPEDIAGYIKIYDEGFEAIAAERYRRQRESGVLDERYPRSSPIFDDFAGLPAEQREESVRRMAVYAAMTDRIDQGLTELVDALEASGELENTLILFTSDNGASAERVWAPSTNREIGAQHPVGSVGRWASLGANWANVSNTPFRFFKNFSYAGGTVSPLIAHWPAGIDEPGRIVHDVTHLVDVLPTLLAVSDTAYPDLGLDDNEIPGPEGISLAPAFAGEPLLRGTPVFQRWSGGRSVRTARWKLLSWAGIGEAPEDAPWLLFDMQSDRTETTDVAADHPDVVARLAGAYDAWLRRVKPGT